MEAPVPGPGSAPGLGPIPAVAAGASLTPLPPLHALGVFHYKEEGDKFVCCVHENNQISSFNLGQLKPMKVKRSSHRTLV